MRRFHTKARPCLARAPVFINEDTRLLVAAGFREAIGRLGIVVQECAIMNNHVHLLVQRLPYRIEYVVNQLKGAATRTIGLSETPWARKGWNVFLDDLEAVDAAAEYIRANPPAAGLAPQRWDFLRPL